MQNSSNIVRVINSTLDVNVTNATLDVNVTNATPIDVNIKEVSFERIILLSGQNQTAAVNQLLGADGSSQAYTGFASPLGVRGPRVFYAYFSAASGTKTINYTYVDASGNLQSVSGLSLTFNTYTALAGGASIAMVNSFELPVGVTLGASQEIHISYTNTAVGRFGFLNNSGVSQQALYCVPNGKKVRVTAVAMFAAASSNWLLLKWNANGYITTSWNWFSITNVYHVAGFNGAFSSYSAGEVIAMGVSNSVANKHFNLSLVETDA